MDKFWHAKVPIIEEIPDRTRKVTMIPIKNVISKEKEISEIGCSSDLGSRSRIIEEESEPELDEDGARNTSTLLFDQFLDIQRTKSITPKNSSS